jgi:hypothetical protein
MIKIGKSYEDVLSKKPFPRYDTSTAKNYIYNNEDNFAIVTGKLNDIIVIDLDYKDPQFTAYQWFIQHFGSLDDVDTLVTKTINNGFHIYFKYTDQIMRAFTKINIDILSDKYHVTEGKGYSVVYDKPIRHLKEYEINALREICIYIVCLDGKYVEMYAKDLYKKLAENSHLRINE